MQNLDDDKPSIEKYEPDQNVSLWLHRLNTERLLSNWSDAVAVAEASLLLGDIALTWFLNTTTLHSSWKAFDLGMRQRFGDTEQRIVAHIMHRKQRDTESVQSYVDDLNLLFAQCNLPENMQLDLLLDNLRPQLRKKVIATIPKTVEQLITNAIYLEQKSAGFTIEKVKERAQHRAANKLDSVERVKRSIDRFANTVDNRYDRFQHMPQLVGLEGEY